MGFLQFSKLKLASTDLHKIFVGLLHIFLIKYYYILHLNQIKKLFYQLFSTFYIVFSLNQTQPNAQDEKNPISSHKNRGKPCIRKTLSGSPSFFSSIDRLFLVSLSIEFQWRPKSPLLIFPSTLTQTERNPRLNVMAVRRSAVRSGQLGMWIGRETWKWKIAPTL